MAKDKIAKQDMVKVGDVYGELTVLEEDFEREQLDVIRHPKGRHFKYFKCKCSCGKETTVQVYQLLYGKTKSCGHLKRDNTGAKPIDLTGKVVNDLEIIRIDDNRPKGYGKHAYWICRCLKCGKEKSIRSTYLVDGSAIDCGCEQHKRFAEKIQKDLKGKVIGHLHVLERDWDSQQSGKHARWICQCDLCGRIEKNSSGMLTNYGKDRCRICGGFSIGEQKIFEILTDNDIKFEHDKGYKDLKYPDTGGVPRFDFRITQNSDCDYIIEFDGEQHFKQVPLYDTKDLFKRRQFRDNFKNQWCKDHNIPLIRIPYTRLNKICLADLIPDTSNYLVA